MASGFLCLVALGLLSFCMSADALPITDEEKADAVRQLLALFQNDGKNQRDGHMLRNNGVECQDDDYEFLTSSEGAIQSPNYPSKYPKNFECGWFISPPDAQSLTLTFETFDLQSSRRGSCYDYVQIYEFIGEDVYDVGEYCGSSSPGTITTSGSVYILFYSNRKKRAPGFYMTWQATGGAGDGGAGDGGAGNGGAGNGGTGDGDAGDGGAGDNGDDNGGGESGTCGLSSENSRVLGGEESALAQWPWQARIRIYVTSTGYFNCGGTLISDEWVVSAAHCIEYEGEWITNGNNFEIYLGEVDANAMDPNEVKLKASKVVVHEDRIIPASDYDTEPHDIIMIKLERKVVLNSHLNVACLPDSTEPVPVGTECYISGFGVLGNGVSATSPQLMHVDVEILNHNKCTTTYGGQHFTDDYLCAGSYSNLVDACAGDSGGPLVCPNADGRFTAEGVVAFGAACDQREKTPGAYASIREHLSWIQQTMQNE